MSRVFFLLNLFVTVFSVLRAGVNADSTFDQYYKPWRGLGHMITIDDQRREVQLSLDKSSGGVGSGFVSKTKYCFGSFRIMMKIPENGEGIITSFFMITSQNDEIHNEFDFEFVGANPTPQLNVFASGHREEAVQLWFDPSKDFHTYQIVWSRQQTAFYVDSRPIRRFAKSPGVGYPSKPMFAEATIWNGSWAGSVDWSKAPFVAYYRGFNIDAPQANGTHLCY